MSVTLRSRVQKFPAWHTKADQNGKCCEGYDSAIYGEVNVSVEKCVEIKGDYVKKIANLFYFYRLKKLVRPETFGPYHVCLYVYLLFVYLITSVISKIMLCRMIGLLVNVHGIKCEQKW